MGLGFWRPMSEMPEQGICFFPTRADAEEHRQYLTAECDTPLDPAAVTIEPFDRTLHVSMTQAN